MPDDTCLKCRSTIPAAAERCPECSYEPAAQGKLARTAFYVVGGLLTATGVGAIVGVPLIAIAYYDSRQKRDRSPTTHAP